MKKNILLVQSLFLLPLIIATPLLSMNCNQKQGPNRKERRSKEKQQKKVQQQQQKIQEQKDAQCVARYETRSVTKAQEKEPVSPEKIQEQVKTNKTNFQTALKELHSSKIFIQQQLLHNGANEENIHQDIQPLPSNLLQSEHEVVNIALPEPNALWASVLLPVEEKQLSFFEKLTYYTSTSNQILQQIISDLETGAFDARYKTSFDALEEVITTATNNNDIQSLATIASLCQQKYPITIRISDKVAQPALKLLKTHYSKELTLTNDKLQNKHDEKTRQWNMATLACMTSILNAINSYQQNIEGIYTNYNTSVDEETKRITDLKRDVTIFNGLCHNRDTRLTTLESLSNEQLRIPHNKIHSSIMSESENRLVSVGKTIEIIPTIKGLKTNPQYIEELTTKCLTNK
ncbi:MAG TPA: hypothetical protein VHX42_00220 [Candidatus Babeliales bacterium]|nr:hypothetical protein [Candidatus Babeliales bacterium]